MKHTFHDGTSEPTNVREDKFSGVNHKLEERGMACTRWIDDRLGLWATVVYRWSRIERRENLVATVKPSSECPMAEIEKF
ncbi:hypothetical protein EVAR_94975_1 [Eumeta japonica]|uniref:Uncharacterized protein n=1 Tax=Eumeta variegata TaxID=151549 RepID=A0A4C1UV68_EUMVA|nr:hypothetical protein EVAR_94975_1 [Eumeta japonica]